MHPRRAYKTPNAAPTTRSISSGDGRCAEARGWAGFPRANRGRARRHCAASHRDLPRTGGGGAAPKDRAVEVDSSGRMSFTPSLSRQAGHEPSSRRSCRRALASRRKHSLSPDPARGVSSATARGSAGARNRQCVQNARTKLIEIARPMPPRSWLCLRRTPLSEGRFHAGDRSLCFVGSRAPREYAPLRSIPRPKARGADLSQRLPHCRSRIDPNGKGDDRALRRGDISAPSSTDPRRRAVARRVVQVRRAGVRRARGLRRRRGQLLTGASRTTTSAFGVFLALSARSSVPTTGTRSVRKLSARRCSGSLPALANATIAHALARHASRLRTARRVFGKLCRRLTAIARGALLLFPCARGCFVAALLAMTVAPLSSPLLVTLPVFSAVRPHIGQRLQKQRARERRSQPKRGPGERHASRAGAGSEAGNLERKRALQLAIMRRCDTIRPRSATLALIRGQPGAETDARIMPTATDKRPRTTPQPSPLGG